MQFEYNIVNMINQMINKHFQLMKWYLNLIIFNMIGQISKRNFKYINTFFLFKRIIIKTIQIWDLIS